jgi:uncharacterized protein YcbX
MRLLSVHTYPVKGGHRVDHDTARVHPWGLAGDRRWMVVDADGRGITQRDSPRLVALRARVRPAGLLLRAAGRVDGVPELPEVDVPEPVGTPPVPVRVFDHYLPVPALPAGEAADDWLGRLLGRPARLVWLARPARHVPAGDPAHDPGDQVSFADAYPLLLTTTASLAALNGWRTEGEALPMTRFRPNLVIEGAPAWAEDAWTGHRIRIGPVGFRVARACGRCLVTTIDQETGTRGREPLLTLAAHRRIDRKLLFGVYLVPDGDAGAVSVGDPVQLD